jgi:hypothetical protein
MDVDTAVTLDLMLAAQADVYGYTCKATPSTPFVQGNTKVDLGSNDYTALVSGLPFPISYYGNSYDKVWVSSNGVATFVDPGDSYLTSESVSLPDRMNAPRASVFPFWDFIEVDDQASVWSGSIGTGADQRFVIEWRNMKLIAPGDPRISYEVIFSPGGDVTFNYSGLSTTDDNAKGIDAAVGITSPGGGYGLQYSFQQPALVSGTAITFTYPADPQPISYGSLSGTVSANGVRFPHAGIGLDNFPTTTDSTGHYRFDSVETGTYNLEGSSGCDAATIANVDIEGDVTVDLNLTPMVDDFGYSCGLTPVDWIPANTVMTEDYPDVDLPFAFPFYGQTFTTAQVGADGVYLRRPDNPASGGAIEFWPGANVIPDAQSTLRVETVGTVPNRRFVVEARDVPLREAPDIRVTYEVVLGEDGAVTVAFHDPPDPSLLPHDIIIWFISVASGTIRYKEDGRGLLSRNAVVFRPPVA